MLAMVKGLEGKTVREVKEHLVPDEETVDGTSCNGYVIECEDGYTVAVTFDEEDCELAVTRYAEGYPRG